MQITFVVFCFLLSGNMEEVMILGSQFIALEVHMCGRGLLLK